MKKIFIASCFYLLPFSINAQNKPAIQERDIPVKESKEINWSAFINTDYVADGYTTRDVNNIEKGKIIQVRFYERGMSPMDLGQQRPYAISGYKISEHSDILSVKALSDGGVSIIMATGNKNEGPFSETISILNPTSRGYLLTIKGIIEEPVDKNKK